MDLATIIPDWSLEKHLGSHDVEFPLPSVNQPSGVFRVLLLSTEEAETQAAKDRVARLSLLDGGKRIAIVLLLVGEEGMMTFANLQMRYVEYRTSSLIYA